MNNKLKIIHITAAYKPAFIYGGPTMSVAKLCECLQSWGNGELGSLKEKLAIEVFTTTANGKIELEVETKQRVIVDGVNVTYFKRLTKDHTHFSLDLLLNLRREILLHQQSPPPTPSQGGHSLTKNERRQANKQRTTNNELIIHIHAWWNLVSVLSCFIAKWYRIPIVLSSRGMLTNYTQTNRNSFSKRIIHQLLGKKLIRYCHIHATSEQEKEDVLTIVRPKCIKVISNLIELERGTEVEDKQTKNNEQSGAIFQPSGNGKSPFKLIFLSRIEEKKGLDMLFDALAIVDFDFNLSIGGSGDENYIQSLKNKTAALKIDQQITWLGQISNEDKFKVLQKHELMVLTSYNENFANVVVESLSVGTPVLISDKVGLSTYVLNNNLGFITALNANTIAKNLNIAFKEVDKRNKISKLAPAYIAKDFSNKTLTQKYIQLYTDIANGRL